MRDNNSSSSAQVISLIAGIGIGVGLVAWMQGKDGKNGRMLKEKVEEVGNNIADSLNETWENSQDTIQELFGEANAQTQLAYLRTRQQLNARVEELMNEFGKLSKDKYAKLVAEVIEDLQENKSMSNDQVKTLKKYLSDDYSRLQKKLSA